MSDPQDLCETLADEIRANLEAILSNQPKSFPAQERTVSLLELAKAAGFLDKANERVSATSEDPKANIADVIGSQEGSMFLASYQKRTLYCSKTRVNRWARAFDHKKQITSEEGILVKQFPGIGVKVEEEFIMNLLTGDEG